MAIAANETSLRENRPGATRCRPVLSQPAAVADGGRRAAGCLEIRSGLIYRVLEMRKQSAYLPGDLLALDGSFNSTAVGMPHYQNRLKAKHDRAEKAGAILEPNLQGTDIGDRPAASILQNDFSFSGLKRTRTHSNCIESRSSKLQHCGE